MFLIVDLLLFGYGVHFKSHQMFKHYEAVRTCGTPLQCPVVSDIHD